MKNKKTLTNLVSNKGGSYYGKKTCRSAYCLPKEPRYRFSFIVGIRLIKY